MLYQLPTGKVISLSIEEYLNLTEEDIEYLISINFGEHHSSPWAESSIQNKVPITGEGIDDSIDYAEDPDEILAKTCPNIIFTDDLEDFSDVDFSELEDIE